MKVVCIEPFFDIQRRATVFVGDTFDTDREELIERGFCKKLAEPEKVEEPVKRGRKKKAE